MKCDDLVTQVYSRVHSDLDKAIADWLGRKLNDQQFTAKCSLIGQWLVDHLGEGAKQ